MRAASRQRRADTWSSVRLAVAVTVALMVGLAALPPHPSARSATRSAAAPVEVAYGRDPAQRMDVTAGRGVKPGVFIVHGGWWSGGDKSDLRSGAATFAAAGYAVFNVNYRLTGVAHWPAQRDDVAAAITYARAHAASYGFDPSRWLLVGFSAGGHLAASIGSWPERPPGLRGVVGMSPPVSPTAAYTAGAQAGASDLVRKLRTSAVALAGCQPTTATCKAQWRSMEAAAGVGPRSAALLAFHSRDEFVPPAPTQELAARLREAGVTAVVRVLAGSGHSTALWKMPAVSQEVLKWADTRLVAKCPPP
ncbi:alpha/beta hydrolase [Planomonospora sp. ID82291]|uniref:alpha/beta hydrolase n=1 Tax=Planomonospora sp. ID82291 TaxID=2738136 RepID=UPI0018C3B7A8|nr:alpha/beta hydrolase [Planomonospora sp. ID82291]MBG0818759.1 alpha/beta hydrolase [Planomonospora sp. ID82291]